MIVGGVAVPSDRGPMGHSDGDVLTHAIIDAILGGAGLGDIGTHFPSGDESFKGVASTELLRATAKLLSEHGCRATYVDATVILERPVLKPYVDRIAGSIAGCLGLDREVGERQGHDHGRPRIHRQRRRHVRPRRGDRRCC